MRKLSDCELKSVYGGVVVASATELFNNTGLVSQTYSPNQQAYDALLAAANLSSDTGLQVQVLSTSNGSYIFKATDIIP